MNKSDEFVNWLNENCDLSQSTMKKYSGAINTISKELSKYNFLEGSLYNIEDPSILESKKKIYLSIPEYMRKDEKGNRMYSNALKYFILYHSKNIK